MINHQTLPVGFKCIVASRPQLKRPFCILETLQLRLAFAVGCD
jgi:hypothetical protein